MLFIWVAWFYRFLLLGEDVIPFAPTEGYRMGSAEKILFAPISLICLNVVGTNLVVLKFDNLCEQIHIARPCRNFLIKHAFLFYLNLDLEEISVILCFSLHLFVVFVAGFILIKDCFRFQVELIKKQFVFLLQFIDSSRFSIFSFGSLSSVTIYTRTLLCGG